MVKKLRLVQVAYKSEWALAKFFDALRDPSIAEKYELTAICGREETKEKALDSLFTAIEEKVRIDPKFRAGQRAVEINNTIGLLRKLVGSEVNYFRVNGGESLPEAVYDLADIVVIHSKNTKHLGYIEDAMKHLKHVLCEKPVVTVMNGRKRADRRNLSEIEKLAESARVVLMDAEHYSYKKASLIFYENLETLLDGKKIKSVEGRIYEKDGSDFGRTKEVLSPDNETGSLTDTGVHLLAFISNLGGKATPEKAKYDTHPGFYVETYVDAEYTVSGKLFAEGAQAKISAGKFIDHFVTPLEKEEKVMRFTLEDESEITLDLSGGTVKKKDKQGEREYSFRYFIPKNEYVSILYHLQESLANLTPPLTNFSNSIVTLDSIYRTLLKFPIIEAQNNAGVYKR